MKQHNTSRAVDGVFEKFPYKLQRINHLPDETKVLKSRERRLTALDLVVRFLWDFIADFGEIFR